MKPKAFNFYLDYDENIEALSDEEVGQLIRALLVYAKSWENGEGTMPEMSQIIKVAFVPMKKRIGQEFAAYEQKSKTNSDNARKRWERVAHQDNAKECETMRTHEEEKEEEKEYIKKLNKKECERNFEKFWEAYPRKVGKQNAHKAFLKLKVDSETLEKILFAIKQQKSSEQWQDERYIPHPTTWLNGARWNDELPKASPKKSYGDYLQRPIQENPRFGFEYLDRVQDEEDEEQEVL